MSGDGIPEESTKQLGEAIAKLRTNRKLTRTALVNRVLYQLPNPHPLADTLGENWFNRLENGRMVKVPQEAIEAILRALNCTPSERATVLMHANRNPLADAQGVTTPQAEFLGQIMVELYENPRAKRVLEDLRSNSRGGKVVKEIAEVIVDLLEAAPISHAK